MAIAQEITVNGVKYVPASSVKSDAQKLSGKPYVIVRTYSAGVFAGYLKSREGKEVELLNARRLWYWDGAASLSELSQLGTKSPENCKFPQEVPSIVLTESIEILTVSAKAKESIDSVKVWTVN
jgi:hypothetical protein